MIELLHPQIISLMLIPALLLLVLLFTRKGKVLREFSDEVLEKLESVQGTMINRKTRLTVLFLAIFLMIVSLSRPVINHGEKEIVTKGSEFVAIIDISRSMLATDIYPNRLDFAKKKLKNFISHTTGDKIGVIGFAGGSFLVSPLTEDRDSLTYLVDSLDSDRISIGGSDLLSALEAADEMMKNKKRAVLIFSDGGEGDFAKEIDFAKEKDLKIFSVGIATDKGAPIPGENGGFIKQNGNIVVTSLNKNLQNLGTQTGGGYIEGGFGDGDMKNLYGAIKGVLDSKTHEKKKIEDLTELFYYPLSLALLLLFIGFHSLPKRSLAIVLLLFSFSENSHALSFDFKDMNSAEELYKSGKYQEAEKAFSKIEDPSLSQKGKIDYNIGNAKFRRGDFQGAIKSYEESLKSNPSDADAKHNLEVAKKRLEEKKKKEQQKQQKDKDKKDKNNKENQKQKDSQKNQEKEKNKEQEKKDKEKAEKDKKTQEEEKKQQRKESKEKEKPSKAEQEAKEMEKRQREKDLKNEHWLKRLKDIKNPIPLKQLKKNEGNSNANPW